MKKWILGALAVLALCLLVVFGRKTSHTHQFGDWETITEADCVTEGLKERTCDCGKTEKKTIPALGHTEVTDEAVEATCTETGLTEGKHCSVCKKVLVAQQTIPALGHKEVVDAGVSPTCTRTGLTKGKHCSVCKEVLVTKKVVSAKGHSYGKPVWSWSGYTDATATFTCADDSSHVKAVTAAITKKVTTAATCEAEGMRTYTAAVTLGGKTYTDTKTEVIPAMGHSYGEPVWSWSDDFTTATASFPCANDSSHVVKETGTITNAVTTAAACETEGVRTYTAEVTFGGKTYTDTKDEVIPATGHSYGGPVWNWSGYTAAKATFTCANDSNHVVTETATITSKVTTAATCEKIGKRTYTATVTFGGKTYTDTAIEDIPVIPHSYENDICTQCLQPRHSEGLKYTDNSDGTCYVSGIGSCTDTVLVIPRNYQGKAVTSIGKEAFRGCIKLTSVTIPSSVTSIGDSAFYYCIGLTGITIPDSVTSIGSYAFSDCSSLTGITLGNGVTSIGSYAFSNCRALTGITIPDSVTNIGKLAFSGCKGLTSVTLGNGVTSIGDLAFNSCTSLTGITIPSSVTSIGDKAFNSCTGLTGITIPSSVTSIRSTAFQGCSNLGSISVDTENAVYHSAGNCLIETSANNLVFGCKNSVIPSSVTSISDSAFYGCTGLTNIAIPDSVTTIGGYAFYGCSGLTSINIPSRVTSIATYAFARCTGLTNIAIPDSVTTIGEAAFFRCTGLTNIAIPDSVTRIDQSAFSACTALTSVTIPGRVTSIGLYAFQSCSNLGSVIIENGVTSIGKYMFKDCGKLANVTIGNSVETIRDSAFMNCSSLTSITFNGTTSQWNSINKSTTWDAYSGTYTVHCTDGDINK